jgi:AcrR family transcriptional regulator
MATRTRLDPDARRAAILDAARQLFAGRPYDAISVQDLADAAGVTRGLVHHYFGGKDDVLAAVMRDTALPTAIALDPALPLRTRVTRRVNDVLDVVEANREAWLATLAVGHAIPAGALRDAAESIWRAQYECWVTSFADVLRDTPRVRGLYRAYMGLNQATCRQWLTGDLSREDAALILTTAQEQLLATVGPALSG